MFVTSRNIVHMYVYFFRKCETEWVISHFILDALQYHSWYYFMSYLQNAGGNQENVRTTSRHYSRLLSK